LSRFSLRDTPQNAVVRFTHISNFPEETPIIEEEAFKYLSNRRDLSNYDFYEVALADAPELDKLLPVFDVESLRDTAKEPTRFRFYGADGKGRIQSEALRMTDMNGPFEMWTGESEGNNYESSRLF